MIKPDDIKKHTAEFFTSDPDFVLWCLDPERAQDGYWCGYTERHPQDLVEFERAVSLVRRVGKTHPALPSVEKPLLLDRILTDHYARCRFAAPPRRRNRAALFAAASLLVAGVVAALFWSADFTGSGLPSAEAYENITLVTREGSREVYDDIARISLTPKGEILIDGKENEGAETDRRTPRQEVRVHTSELVVPKGKRAHLQLSDGTRVWINSASVLRFPSAFGDTRDVFVEGEAYFEVAKDANRPFIVHRPFCDPRAGHVVRRDDRAPGRRFVGRGAGRRLRGHRRGRRRIGDAESFGTLLDEGRQLFGLRGRSL